MSDPLRGNLTAKTNEVVEAMRFSGTSSDSVLIASQRANGEACVSLHWSTGNFGSKLDHFWAAMLTNEQRIALGEMLLRYKPVLFEDATKSGV